MKINPAILLTTFVVGLLATALIQTPPMPDSPPSAWVEDNSISRPKPRCEDLPAAIDEELESFPAGKDSTFTFFAISQDSSSSYEPVPLFSGTLPPHGNAIGLFEDGKADRFRRGLTEACAAIKPVRTSSIFRAVQVALQHLQVTKGETTAHLIVRTDLAENISRRLARNGGPPPLENEGITVTFCGTAQTSGGGGPRGEEVERLTKLWREAFTEPGRVVFKPYCGRTVTQTVGGY